MTRLRMSINFLIFPLTMGCVLFGSAGRWDLPFVWAYIGVMVASMLAVGTFCMDPGLRQERLRPGPGGTDRRLRWFALPFMVAHWVVAGLDVGRFHWSPAIPIGVHVLGLLGLSASMALVGWAVSANRFFSPVVRIQRERGHHLVTGGPYRYVRHPGYAASLSSCLFGPIALGSLYAAIPLIVLVSLLLRRTWIEDRFLHQELSGYAQYAQRVRARWVPGLW